MHEQVAKSYNKFYFDKKYYFSYISWAQKYINKLFQLYFQENKI
jgi:hypothetical protein